MTSGPTSTELHPVYPSPHAANPAVGILLSEPQTAFKPVAKRSALTRVHCLNKCAFQSQPSEMRESEC